MTEEDIKALVVENARLRTEVTTLQEQVAQLTGQLEAAAARMAELEHQEKKPPPFVKRNRP